jgi:hypothetical protein
MSYETRAYDNEYGNPVVVLVTTGTHDVSRLVNLLAGSRMALCEHMTVSQTLLRQVKRHNGGRAALKLLAAHGGPDLTEPERPRIVCLCGSTRFYDTFQQANYDLTMAGQIVLSVGFYPHATTEHGHGEGVGHDSAEKVELDELHKRKIDLADEVYVLNVGGYIGESTRSEIDYAEKLGKPVRYMEPLAAEAQTGGAA